MLKVDAAKARARLGWRQKVPLPAALDWTIEWYQAFLTGQPARELTERQIDRFDLLSPQSAVEPEPIGNG